MVLELLRGLSLIGWGLLIGFLGLMLVANVFGAVDEQARKMSQSSFRRWVEGRQVSPEEIKQRPGFVLGRYIAGIAFALVGLAAVDGGVVYLITQLS
ncbi:hypothetical protein [Micromonospora sp. NPDC004551]|uniref:hypothetical protein n=1 Tax=Micromonospora sp. NPDC004551 TaxID=3154284 RepID=UPI0033B416DF